MRRLECARPARTTTAHARNAGEAVQQLAQIARERQRAGQERKSLIGRIRKLDARLEAMIALERKLLPMMRQDADRANAAPPSAVTPAKAAVSPTPAAPPPAPPARKQAALPVGLSEQTLQY